LQPKTRSDARNCAVLPPDKAAKFLEEAGIVPAIQ